MANMIGRDCVDLEGTSTVQVKIKRQIVIEVKFLVLMGCLFTGQFVPLVKYAKAKNFSLIMDLNIGTELAVVLYPVSVVDHLNLLLRVMVTSKRLNAPVIRIVPIQLQHA